jgi:hypothetical protein
VTVSDVVASVGRLVDKSLVDHDPRAGRYRILETVRQFAFDRLRDREELDATRQRHAGYWADRAVAANDPYEPNALEGMLTDVFTMLDWAMTHDGDMADRVLAYSSPQLFGLGRWPDLPRACDWMLADRARGPYWPAAVGAVCLAAVIVGRLDVLHLTGDALRAAQEAGDERTVQHLSVAHAYQSAALGDLQPSRALVAACVASGNGGTAFQIATGLGDPLACLGQLDELTEMTTISGDLAAGWGLDLKDCNVGPLKCIAHHLAGDLTTPVERLPDRPVSWKLFSRYLAAMAGRVAVARDDLPLQERAAKLIDLDDTSTTDTLVQVVDWARAILTGDLDTAVRAAVAATDKASRHVFHTGRALIDLAATLTAAQRWNDAATTLARLDTLIDTVNEPAPLWRARAGIVAARLALAANDPTAADSARSALTTATAARLRLEQIDALETIAVAEEVAHHPDTAARLLAATTAERQRIGYHGRLTTPAIQALVDRLASTHNAAWNVGSTQPLDHLISRMCHDAL